MTSTSMTIIAYATGVFGLYNIPNFLWFPAILMLQSILLVATYPFWSRIPRTKTVNTVWLVCLGAFSMISFPLYWPAGLLVTLLAGCLGIVSLNLVGLLCFESLQENHGRNKRLSSLLAINLVVQIIALYLGSKEEFTDWVATTIFLWLIGGK